MPQRPVLSKVPNPLFSSARDIKLFNLSQTIGGLSVVGVNLCGSSLEGQRSIADFFHILDHLIVAVDADDYKLQKLDDERRPLSDPLLERSSPGNIIAGNYLIKSTTESGMITFKTIATFSDFSSERPDSSSKLAATRAKLNGGESTGSEKSSRDLPDDNQSFKMRLVYRDKGCAVCLATGIQAIYKYPEDSNRYEGGHIIDFAHHKLWDARGYSAVVSDPFTDPANAGNKFASPSTRTKKDLRRINSLDNGILLCLTHHKDYNNFRFAIHAETHKIFSFHPLTAELHDIEVKAPWKDKDVLYPPPHPWFLESHYFTSISRNMKGNGDHYELNEDGEDYEELSELEEVRNEQVRIWLDGSFSGREITSSHFMAGNKNNVEMMADMQGDFSIPCTTESTLVS